MSGEECVCFFFFCGGTWLIQVEVLHLVLLESNGRSWNKALAGVYCFVNDLCSFPKHKPKCCVHSKYLFSTLLLQLDAAMHILQILVLF